MVPGACLGMMHCLRIWLHQCSTQERLDLSYCPASLQRMLGGQELRLLMGIWDAFLHAASVLGMGKDETIFLNDQRNRGKEKQLVGLVLNPLAGTPCRVMS